VGSVALVAGFFMRGRMVGMHCSHCGTEIATSDAQLDRPKWLCAECAKLWESAKRTRLVTVALLFVMTLSAVALGLAISFARQ
jgi:hypothetical protein